MGALGVILARAGSKGLPGKNLAIVAGKPCAVWTIEAARESKLVTRVALSTDSLELQRLALEMGVDVVARPPELASDTARVDDAARHAVEAVGENTETIVILYANVPVRPPGLVDRAVARLEETGADSVQSYAPVGKHHPWWTSRVRDDDHRVEPWEGDTLFRGEHRRQALPPAYVPDGGVLAVTRASLTASVGATSPHAFLGEDHRAVINDEGAIIDIDSRVDLLVADAVLRERADAARISPP